MESETFNKDTDKKTDEQLDAETKRNTSEMRRKGLALATSVALGATIGSFTSSSINKYKEDTINQTNKVITSTTTDDIYPVEDEEPIYVSGGKFIKTYADSECQEYLKVFSTSSFSEKYGSCSTKYEFKTPEYSQPMYVPFDDVVEYISVDIKIDDPALECTNFRMNPMRSSNNIIKKITTNDTIYVNFKGCQKEDDNNSWFEAIYNDDGVLIQGYFCDNIEERKNGCFEYTFNDYGFSYVPSNVRLYTDQEVHQMYYEVVNKEGTVFTEKAGSYDNAIVIPKGTIIRGVGDVTVKKSSIDDKYAWVKCKIEDDGIEKVGYVQYRSREQDILKGIPKEQLTQEINKQR